MLRVMYFRKTAEQGDNSAKLMIGYIRESENKITEALKWFQKALENGNDTAKKALKRLREKQ